MELKLKRVHKIMQNFKKFTRKEFDYIYLEDYENCSCEKSTSVDENKNSEEKIYVDLNFRTDKNELLVQKIAVPIKISRKKGVSSATFDFKSIEFCCNLNFSIEDDQGPVPDFVCECLFIDKLISIDSQEDGYLSTVFLSILSETKQSKMVRKIRKEIKYYNENSFIFNKI